MIDLPHRSVPARRSPADIRAHDLRKLWALLGLTSLFILLVITSQLLVS